MSNETNPFAAAADDSAAIALAEFMYWRDVPDSAAEIAIGATAAAANIFAAIKGHRAPWHPPKKQL